MDLDEHFDQGKYRGRTLIEVWRGLDTNHTKSYVQEIINFISRKTDVYQKIYCPIFETENIEKDFDFVIKNTQSFEILCSSEYIVVESDNTLLKQKVKVIIKAILHGKFHLTNSSYFKTHYEDVRHLLPCEELKIYGITRVANEKFILHCSQIIIAKKQTTLQLVDSNFLEKNNLWQFVADLNVDGIKSKRVDIHYPIIDGIASNIQTELSTNNEHPVGHGLKLEPLTSQEDGQLRKTKNGEQLFLRTMVVTEPARHKLDFDEYSTFEAPLSDGSKELLTMIGDPNYIEYCLRTWENFYILKDDLNEMLNEKKPHTIKFTLDDINDSVLKYTCQFIEYEYNFNRPALEENDYKCKKIENTQDDFEHFQESENFDEFNGIYGLDDDTINDAFEGNPENYWNID